MNKKIISISKKDVNWFIDELKSIGLLSESIYSSSLIRSLQSLFYSFQESDETLLGIQNNFIIFNTDKLMNFIRENGGGLEAIKLLSTELKKSNIQNFINNNCSLLGNETLKWIQHPSNSGIYLPAIILFFNIFRFNLHKNPILLSFAREMYIQIDKEMSAQIDRNISEGKQVDIEIIKCLPSFINFFRDEDYMPLIISKHWKDIIDFIKNNESDEINEIMYAHLLTDILLKAELALDTNEFNKLMTMVATLSGELLEEADFSGGSITDEDSILLLCFLYVVLISKNEGTSFNKKVNKAIEYLKNHSNHLTKSYQILINQLKAVNDPLIDSLYRSTNKSVDNASWIYPLIVNRMKSQNKTIKNEYTDQIAQTLSSLKNFLLFIVYYQQMLIFYSLKANVQMLSLNKENFLDFSSSIDQKYKENLQSAVRFMPSSPLAFLNPLSLVPNSIIEEYLKDPSQLFTFILNMIISSNYSRLDMLKDVLNKISELDDKYSSFYNDFLDNYLQDYEYNDIHNLFLLELLSHKITSKENKTQIIDLLSESISKKKPEFTFLLNILYDFNIQGLTDNQLNHQLSQLKSVQKNKPNANLRTLVSGMNLEFQKEFISNVWTIVRQTQEKIEAELKLRKEIEEKKEETEKQKTLEEEKRKAELKELKALEEERKKEEALLIESFKSKMEEIKKVLDATLPSQQIVDEIISAIKNQDISTINDKTPLSEQRETFIKTINVLQEYVNQLKEIMEEAGKFEYEATLLDEKTEEPSEFFKEIVSEMLGLNIGELKPALKEKIEIAQDLYQQADSTIIVANKIILLVKDSIKQIDKLVSDKEKSALKEKERIQEENIIRQKKAKEEQLEKQKQQDIDTTQEIVIRFIKQRQLIKPKEDIVSALDKELGMLKNDFDVELIEDITIAPDEYDSPLKGILKEVQTRKSNENVSYITFNFNNYSLAGELDSNGSLFFPSMPAKLENNKVLQSILNKIALTLIIGNKKTQNFKLKVSDSLVVNTVEKSKAHRLNSFNTLIKNSEGKYFLSLDGSQIVEDIDEQRKIVLSTDFFAKEIKNDKTILIPIIAKDKEGLKAELLAHVEAYGAENVVQIVLTRSHRRRLVTKVAIPKAIDLLQTEVVLKNNESVVSETTIRRYLENYKGLKTDASQQAFIDSIIFENQKDPYLLKDDDHPLGVSFGHTEVSSGYDSTRVAYTFVRDSVSLVSLFH